MNKNIIAVKTAGYFIEPVALVAAYGEIWRILL